MRAKVLLAMILLSGGAVARAQDAQPAPPAPAGAAQITPPAAYTIRSNARLVVLDMVVSDAKGHAVKGISREHFHVTEDKDPQTLVNFDEAGNHTAPMEGTINSTAELDKIAPQAPVNIILLDEFNTLFEDMAFARYSLKKYLTRTPGPLDTPTMLIAVSLQKFTVLEDYTQDRQKILDALDHHFVQYPWQAHNGGWISERYSLAFQTLRRVAEATQGHPGHKNMIWVGRGFPSTLVGVSIDTDQQLFHVVQDTVNILRDARVTLYTIDPAGLQIDPGKYGEAAALEDPFGGNFQFSRLALATGGRTLYGRNDVDAEIGTAIQDGSSFYTASYRPTNNSNDYRDFRKIKATVDLPGLTVTTRTGYYVAAPPRRVNPEAPSKLMVNDLVSAASSRMVYDALNVTVKPEAGKADTWIVHVDGPGVTWYYATAEKPRHAECVVLIDTFDKKDKPLHRVAKEIRIDAPTTVAPTGRIERPLNMEFVLDHDPKAVRARFVVRMSPQGKIGTADAVLEP